MPADRRLGKLKRANQIGHSQFTPLQQPKEAEPGRISERSERAHQGIERLLHLFHSLSRMEGYSNRASGSKCHSAEDELRT